MGADYMKARLGGSITLRGRTKAIWFVLVLSVCYSIFFSLLVVGGCLFGAEGDVGNPHMDAKGFNPNPAAGVPAQRFSSLREWVYVAEAQEMAHPLHHLPKEGISRNWTRGREGHPLRPLDTGAIGNRHPRLSEVSIHGRYVVVAHHQSKPFLNEAEGVRGDDPTCQDRTFRQRECLRPKVSPLSDLMRSELEVHVIDSRHILLYLPTGDEGDIATALPSLSAVPLDSRGGWQIIDLYGGGSRGGPKFELLLFKLSKPLKELVTAARNCTYENRGALASLQRRLSKRVAPPPLSGTLSLAMRRLRISVSTARGRAKQVLEDLTRDHQIQGGDPKKDERDVTGVEASRHPGVGDGASCVSFPARPGAPEGVAADMVWVDFTFPPLNADENHSNNGRLDTLRTADTSLDVLRSACSCVLKILKIASHPSVRWLEADAPRVELLNMKGTAILQSGYNQNMDIRLMRPLWDAGLNGTGEIVAISDTGLDVNSCYFYDPMHTVARYPNLNHEHRKIISYHDCEETGTGGTLNHTDQVGGHGTHVSGSAVGSALFSMRNVAKDYSEAGKSEIAQYNGMAPGAKLFFRGLSCGGQNLVIPPNFHDVFSSAYKNGVRIFSNSWGFPSLSEYGSGEKLVDSFAYDHDDMLLLFAAGNDPNAGIYTPGQCKNVLTVGAHPNSLDPAEQDTVSHFSHGPVYDNRRKPDLVGPGGVSVVSAKSLGAGSKPHCTLFSKYGTSMATGLVAGATALVREYLRTRLASVAPSAALVKALLIHSTASLPHPNRSGFGRLDLSIVFGNHSIAATGGGANEVVQSQIWMVERVKISHADTHTYCFSTAYPGTFRGALKSGDTGAMDHKPETTKLRATLVWVDIPIALEGSPRSLVHDIDLAIVDHTGKIYYSNTGTPEKRFLDRVNNVEQVQLELTDSLATSLRVVVYGKEIHGSAFQEYALVVSAPGLKAGADDCASEFARLERRNIHVSCPGNCSGRSGATCLPDSRQCMCPPNFTYYDCSLCNADHYCNGHGICDENMICTCFPGAHFSDPRCSVCAKGWYGPRCDFPCLCMNGGGCDKIAGKCKCPQDRTYGGSGCYQGPSCEYCCQNFAGEKCNERSYWCNESGAMVEVDNTGGGYIQVNGFGLYPYSVTCRWRITAPLQHLVLLRYLEFFIEDSHDVLYLYDPSYNESSNNLVREDTGMLKNPFTVKSIKNVLELVFVSDWAGARPGFLLYYRFIPSRQCQISCRAPFNVSQDVVPTLTCGTVLGLPDWCTCVPPHVGWNCNATSARPGADATDGSTGRRLRPAFDFLSSEVTLLLDALPSAAVLHGSGGAGCGEAFGKGEGQGSRARFAADPHCTPQTTPIEVIARMPMIINGYSLLHVRAPIGSQSLPPSHVISRGSTWHVNLTIIPINSTWIGDVEGLKLGVAQVHQLNSDIQLSEFFQMQLLDLYACPDRPTLSMLVPLRPKLLEDSKEDKRWATAELLITLLWNASKPVSWRLQKHLSVDAVVFGSVLSYTAPLMLNLSKSYTTEPGDTGREPVYKDEAKPKEGVDLRLTCKLPQGLKIQAGCRLHQSHKKIKDEIVYIRYHYLTTLQFVLLIVGCFASVVGISMYKIIYVNSTRWPSNDACVIFNEDSSRECEFRGIGSMRGLAIEGTKTHSADLNKETFLML